MTIDQPDLWGVRPQPAADTYRRLPPELEDKKWPLCWEDCAHIRSELIGQQHPNKNYRIYRLCAIGVKCFPDSICCARRQEIHTAPTTPGWEDY